jgi:hypothetical protein
VSVIRTSNGEPQQIPEGVLSPLQLGLRRHDLLLFVGQLPFQPRDL